MATITQVRATVFCPDGGIPEIYKYPEAAGSQSFKEGQFVYLVSGKLTVCADDATAILGMALKDASGTVDTMLPVAIACERNRFIVNVYHATPASAVTAVTQVGTSYNLEVDSNKCYADIGNSGAPSLLVLAVDEDNGLDVVGDQYGRVIVKVLDSVAQLSA